MANIRKWTLLLCHDRRGVSAIEFAVIASVIVTLMFGAFDLGNAAQQQIALQEAVRTGGQYAIHFPTNPTDIQKAVTNALPSGWTLSNANGVPVVTCSCLENGTTTTYTDCSNPPSNCTSPMLVTISAQMAYKALTPIGAALPKNLAATYVARFQ
jgi:Flp pilus assembly protein TadG